MLISVILNKFSNSTGCFPHLSNKSILISFRVLESAPESFLYIFSLSMGEGK